MAAVNVLVYNGPGTAVSSTERTLSVLRMLLKGRYDVLAAGADVLTHADRAWHASTALLVVPGGRDVPYVESLGTRGSTAIADYVRGGGSYLGICAGAYFASSALEFEKGTALEVAGKRSLALANVVARGSASPGFVYDSEEGAATIHIDVNLDILGPLPNASRPYRVASYCNGAPYFDLIDPASVQVLAKYDSLEVIPAAREKAAIIQTNFGKGHVILMGPHLEHENTLPGLSDWDLHQKPLLICLLRRLGLNPEPFADSFTNDLETSDPFLLSTLDSSVPGWVLKLIKEFGQPVSEHQVLLKDTVNSFKFINCSNAQDWSVTTNPEDVSLPILYSQSVVMAQPSSHSFNLTTFFNNLSADRSAYALLSTSSFGSQILYSPCTTSTQTILEKNYRLSSVLPSGITCIASQQTSGRGRGSNSWISQSGCLMFSLAFKHSEARTALFLQYLFGLAVVQAVKSFEGCSEFPVHLKWPNDIYGQSPDVTTGESVFKKLGGILVNSSYMDGAFSIVIGCGLNVSNPHPTTSINALLQAYNPAIPPLTLEQTLSRILTIFESHYNLFKTAGFRPFVSAYHDVWLHKDQSVYLQDAKVQASIAGLDESGMLKAVGDDGEVYLLQPDGNSFDMMKGLISRKK